MGAKCDAYLALGIPHYWVVDGDARRVLVWSGGATEPVACTDVVTWEPVPAVPPLTLQLDTIFG